MTAILKAAVFASILAFATMACGQDTRDGNRLIKECHDAVRLVDGGQDLNNEELVGAVACVGVIHGELDMLEVFNKVSLPEGSRVSQHVRVVDKYLYDHPEELADRDTFLILKALVGAYPHKVEAK